MMIALRKRHRALRRPEFLHGTGLSGDLQPDVIWHGVEPHAPDFSAVSRTVAYALDGRLTGGEPPPVPDRDLYVACNAWREPLPFRIPPSPSGRAWRRAVDTALASPLDITDLDRGPPIPPQSVYPVGPFSVLVLISEG